MTQILQPGVNIAIAAAVTEVAAEEQRVLFVGQQNSGTAADGVLTENIQNDGSWDILYGEDSMLAEMIRNGRKVNTVSRFDAIGLDDNGGGVDATITLTFTGAATEDGSYEVSVGSSANHSVTVAIADTNTVTQAADAVVAAINADASMPVTAANVAGVVTLTAVNAGTYGNSLGVQITGSVAGLTPVIAAGVTGSVDPLLTAVFDVIGDNRYQTIVWPYPADVDPVTTLLDARFNTDNDVLDGVGVTAAIGSASTLSSTYGSENSQSLVVVGDNTLTNDSLNLNVPSIFEIPSVVASLLGATRALRLTDGANIADFLAGEAGSDAFGGPALASRPYFNTPFSLLPVASTGEGFTAEEIEDLFDDGVSVLGNNKADSEVVAGEIITTYKTDSAGNPDTSFKFLNYVDTSSAVREYMFNNYRAQYAQTRLTEGAVVANRPMANAQSIFATTVGFYNTLSGTDFALTQAGEAPLNTFKNNTTVAVDLATGTATITMNRVPLVTQLRQIDASITISFSATA